MRRRRRAFPSALALTLVFLAKAAVAAGTEAADAWKAELAIDPATLDEVNAAVGSNDDGYRLVLYRERDGDRILGVFSLPTADAAFLDRGRPPGQTIDRGPPPPRVRLTGELK